MGCARRVSSVVSQSLIENSLKRGRRSKMSSWSPMEEEEAKAAPRQFLLVLLVVVAVGPALRAPAAGRWREWRCRRTHHRAAGAAEPATELRVSGGVGEGGDFGEALRREEVLEVRPELRDLRGRPRVLAVLVGRRRRRRRPRNGRRGAGEARDDDGGRGVEGARPRRAWCRWSSRRRAAYRRGHAEHVGQGRHVRAQRLASSMAAGLDDAQHLQPGRRLAVGVQPQPAPRRARALVRPLRSLPPSIPTPPSKLSSNAPPPPRLSSPRRRRRCARAPGRWRS